MTKIIPSEIKFNYFEGVVGFPTNKTEIDLNFKDRTHRSYFTFYMDVPVKVDLNGYYEVYWTCILNCEKGSISDQGVVAQLSSKGSTVMWSGIPIVDKSISRAGKTVFSYVLRALFRTNEPISAPYIRLNVTINWNWLENAVNILDYFYSGYLSTFKTSVIPILYRNQMEAHQDVPLQAKPTLGSTHSLGNHGGCNPLKLLYRKLKRKKPKEKSVDPKPE